MTFAISDFRADVRSILGDLGTDRRHSDNDIDRAVVDAFRRLRDIRPDARYVRGVLKDYSFPDSADDLASSTIDIEERWRMGIVYHAAARRFESDVIDAVNRELASSYFKQAEAAFMS